MSEREEDEEEAEEEAERMRGGTKEGRRVISVQIVEGMQRQQDSGRVAIQSQGRRPVPLVVWHVDGATTAATAAATIPEKRFHDETI